MNIQITVGNEEQLIHEYREYLRKKARTVVFGRPERVGKQFAQVTFQGLHIEQMVLMVEESEAFKVEFV